MYVTVFPFTNSAGVILALLNVFASVGYIVIPESFSSMLPSVAS